MTSEFWTRIRGLFFKPEYSRQLEKVLAGWSVDRRAGDFGLAGKRELFHPLKGWFPEGAERASAGQPAQRTFRNPANDRTGEK